MDKANEIKLNELVEDTHERDGIVFSQDESMTLMYIPEILDATQPEDREGE